MTAPPDVQKTSIAARIAAYAWAAPNTCLGLLAGVAVLASGGRARVVSGNVEFCGGRLAAFASATCPFVAITLGHVIVGTTARDLDAVRAHESVHVRQYEAWGPLFLPAYAASSLWQLARGRRIYRDNFFERQAYARCDISTVAGSACSTTSCSG